MADIFLCRQVGMGGFDRLVVIKRVRDDLRGMDEIIHMFLDEARIAAQISHPNVVQVIEIDEEGGLPYIAMEYVRGLSFADLTELMLRREMLCPWTSSRRWGRRCAPASTPPTSCATAMGSRWRWCTVTSLPATSS